MPQIRIETKAGKDREFLKHFMGITMDAARDVLQLPADDRNIRLMEYEPDFFSAKPPYEYVVEILLFAGRTKGAKKKLYQSIVNELYSGLGVAKESVIIILSEQPRENWGVRGGKPADEIDLGFKVEI